MYLEYKVADREGPEPNSKSMLGAVLGAFPILPKEIYIDNQKVIVRIRFLFWHHPYFRRYSRKFAQDKIASKNSCLLLAGA